MPKVTRSVLWSTLQESDLANVINHIKVACVHLVRLERYKLEKAVFFLQRRLGSGTTGKLHGLCSSIVHETAFVREC